MLRKSKHFITWILLVIFTLYYVDICFFSHSHTINGATIVHSHFHTKDHTEKGTHTERELTLIASLSAFHSLPADVFAVTLEIFLLLQLFILPFCEEKRVSNLTNCISLRAPPFARYTSR